ncbi:MAG: hypothetical protein MK102_15345 [Fuerstiella sp.]|nr:hypothetical protein [Fuerstiella sp.]
MTLSNLRKEEYGGAAVQFQKRDSRMAFRQARSDDVGEKFVVFGIRRIRHIQKCHRWNAAYDDMTVAEL